MQCNIEKAAIRSEMKSKRRSLEKAGIEADSRVICDAFIALEEFKKAVTVCVYMDAFNEVETSLIIEAAVALGKTVAVPVIDGDDIYLCELEGELKKGAFGIREPVSEKRVSNQKPDIFAVPALAFDTHGGRVGFGKGYYDKVLNGSKGFKAGLCYSFQLKEQVPSEPHDILMDCIITEKEIIYCERNCIK